MHTATPAWWEIIIQPIESEKPHHKKVHLQYNMHILHQLHKDQPVFSYLLLDGLDDDTEVLTTYFFTILSTYICIQLGVCCTSEVRSRHLQTNQTTRTRRHVIYIYFIKSIVQLHSEALRRLFELLNHILDVCLSETCTLWCTRIEGFAQ